MGPLIVVVWKSCGGCCLWPSLYSVYVGRIIQGADIDDSRDDSKDFVSGSSRSLRPDDPPKR